MTEDDRFSEAGRKGGEARAAALTEEERSDIARKGAAARWAKTAAPEAEEPLQPEPEEVLEAAEDMPVARWRGTLNIVGMEVPCYVLDNSRGRLGARQRQRSCQALRAAEHSKYISVPKSTRTLY